MCEKRGGEFSWEAVVVGFGVLGRGQGRDRTFHGSNTVKILIVLIFIYMYIRWVNVTPIFDKSELNNP